MIRRAARRRSGVGAFGEQPGDEGAGLDPEPSPDGTLEHGGDEGAGDAGTRRVAAGVQDAGGGMRRFEAEGRAAAGSGVEVHTEAPQPGDVPRCLGAQHPDGLGVVEPGPGGEGVGNVGRHGVSGRGLPRRKHGRNAALGVEGVALLQRSLGQEHHLTCRHGVGGQQRCVQPGDAAADDDQAPGHGRAASIRSRAIRAGAATSSATVMRLTTSPRTSASRTQAR